MNYADMVGPEEMADKREWVQAILAALRTTKTPENPVVVQKIKQGWGELLADRSVAGSPLTLKGTRFERGLGTHANSVIAVTLPKPGKRLAGLAGVDDHDFGTDWRAKMKMVFGVEANGAPLWKSQELKADSAPARVDVALQGAREFILTVTGSEYGPAPADWVDLQVTFEDDSTAMIGEPGTSHVIGFTYGGQDPRDWEVTEESLPSASPSATRRKVTRTDPETRLQVIVELTEYTEFPVVEWMVRFRNDGTSDTPIIANIRSLDILLPTTARSVLHYHTGDYCAPDGYEPHALAMKLGVEKSFAPEGGRPTNRAWPYYNLEFQDQEAGVIIVVGWSGQWASRFACDAQGIRVTAGQELTHLSLHPGEEIRTPISVLMFYRGGRVRSQNLWRRWMMACNMPRPGGRLPDPILPAYTGRWFAEMAQATEETQNAFIDRYIEEGIQLDYWWMDAGWYPCDGNWPKTGTWEPDQKRFPHGLRAVSDHARGQGIKTLVWFEPERVTNGTWLYTERPQWLLGNQQRTQTPFDSYYEAGGVHDNRLLNLGNPDALRWLIAHVSRTIREQGIDLYRQDFNFDPLPYWRLADAPDRQGITEIRYVEGYLAYWQALRAQFPDMLIDSCASGGRRNDLETMRLAVPLHKTDYDYGDLATKQAFHHSMWSWFPYFGAYVLPVDTVDAYAFRSALAPMTMLTYDLRRRDIDWRPLKQLTEEWRRITGAGYFYGDYYPLLPYSRTEGDWIGWQFHVPDKGEGLVQFFRRKESPYVSGRFPLQGLQESATYRVTDLDRPGGECEMTGRELMTSGLPVTTAQAPAAVIMVYRRVR